MKIFMGLIAYVASYLISYFLYEKLGVEKLISRKTSTIISLFLIAVLVCIIGSSIIDSSIIDSFSTTRGYQLLFKSLLSGTTTALIAFIYASLE